MNLLFFLTPKQDVLYIYEDFTLRQTLEKWSNQRLATIPVLKRNGEYVGTITEGDILWGMKNLHGLDLEASEDVPIASFPRRRDYKAVTVTTDMGSLLRVLSCGQVNDLTVTEPDLDEVFLHYYEKDGETV